MMVKQSGGDKKKCYEEDQYDDDLQGIHYDNSVFTYGGGRY